MRIISQDGTIDIPYEMAALRIVENKESKTPNTPWEIQVVNIRKIKPLVMGRYETKNDALAVFHNISLFVHDDSKVCPL